MALPKWLRSTLQTLDEHTFLFPVLTGSFFNCRHCVDTERIHTHKEVSDYILKQYGTGAINKDNTSVLSRTRYRCTFVENRYIIFNYEPDPYPSVGDYEIIANFYHKIKRVVDSMTYTPGENEAYIETLESHVRPLMDELEDHLITFTFDEYTGIEYHKIHYEQKRKESNAPSKDTDSSDYMHLYRIDVIRWRLLRHKIYPHAWGMFIIALIVYFNINSSFIQSIYDRISRLF